MISSFQSCLTNDKGLFSSVNSGIQNTVDNGRQLTALPATSGERSVRSASDLGTVVVQLVCQSCGFN